MGLLESYSYEVTKKRSTMCTYGSVNALKYFWVLNKPKATIRCIKKALWVLLSKQSKVFVVFLKEVHNPMRYYRLLVFTAVRIECLPEIAMR
mmetsp:Transcript_148/g.242  ORF Transcript_148/g.242 Transcript_148/m.242 type:complete len:92 (-) Transcript_148:795-1070(-)